MVEYSILEGFVHLVHVQRLISPVPYRLALFANYKEKKIIKKVKLIGHVGPLFNRKC